LPYAAVAAKDATTMIPIVFQLDDDPIKYGLVTSLSRPGGNVTGMNLLTGELAGKRLNFLRELIPQVTTIGYLSPPSTAPVFPSTPRVCGARKGESPAGGRAGGREIIVSEVRRLVFGAAFPPLMEQRAGALIVASFTNFLLNRKKIRELAARHKIAA